LGLPDPKGVKTTVRKEADDEPMTSKGRSLAIYRAGHDAKYHWQTLPAGNPGKTFEHLG